LKDINDEMKRWLKVAYERDTGKPSGSGNPRNL
jgi:hypothetical protein